MRGLLPAAAVLSALNLLIVAAGPAAAADLMPHRAVYDLRLADDPGADVSHAAGRMVYEFTGSACAGYTIKTRMVIETRDRDDGATTLDLRGTTFEAAAGDSYRFQSSTYSDDVLSAESEGSIGKDASGVFQVRQQKPDASTKPLARGAVFPTTNLLHTIDAARRGETFVQETVFDGTSSDKQIYRTTAIIGRPAADKPDPEAPDALKGTPHWPVSVAYFDPESTGDTPPAYTMGFSLYDNGVVTGLSIDYGNFAMRGRLTSFQPLTPAKCP